MNRSRSLKSRPPGILLTTLGVVAALAGAGAQADGLADLFDGQLPNNFPFLNGAGTAATFSTAGFVDLTNQFHVPQGTNGRSCESCHLPQVGWSIRPVDVELKFLLKPKFHLAIQIYLKCGRFATRRHGVIGRASSW